MGCARRGCRSVELRVPIVVTFSDAFLRALVMRNVDPACRQPVMGLNRSRGRVLGRCLEPGSHKLADGCVLS
jgi:hypothetical protein